MANAFMVFSSKPAFYCTKHDAILPHLTPIKKVLVKTITNTSAYRSLLACFHLSLGHIHREVIMLDRAQGIVLIQPFKNTVNILAVALF